MWRWPDGKRECYQTKFRGEAFEAERGNLNKNRSCGLNPRNRNTAMSRDANRTLLGVSLIDVMVRDNCNGRP
ncbi:MAG: hypothetical protein DMG91_04610 [Acidobacteria bacterium]|nr:MAG: hypothetical protein DMG91_04610 [Acidobacteriota bacterium]